MNGGMQRCFHIIHQLSKISSLTLIIKQPKESFLLATKEFPSIQQINLTSTSDFNRSKNLSKILPRKFEKALRFRWYKRRIVDSADSNFLEYYPTLKKLITKQKFDIVVLEMPAPWHAAEVIRRWSKSTRIIYDAHNVDSNLEKALIAQKKISGKSLPQIEKSEQEFYKTIGEIFTCSVKDKEDFDKINKGRLKISVIPNGVVIKKKLNDTGVRSDFGQQYILFCGVLGTHANIDGISWFYEDIFPEIKLFYPTVKLLILGSGDIPPSLETLKNDESVVFTGKVEDVKPVYEKSVLSVVPLRIGSGTRLKILEAMSYGVPVVSTTVGAEGIDYSGGNDILIADDKDSFARQVGCLLESKEARLKIQKNARKLVEEKYDWDKIGEKLAAVIYE